MDIIKSIEHEQLKASIPDLKVGNTVKVHVRIKEGNKERVQVFEGIIIKVQGVGVNKSFTVRKLSYGVGVEKTFLVHSPLVEKVELVRVGRARRARLFYLRDRIGKAAKTKEVAGARIEDKEIIIKGAEAEEDVPVVEEELVEEVKAEEVVEANVAETTQEVKEEEATAANEEVSTEEAPEAEEAPKAEAKEEVKEEKVEKEEVKEEVKEEAEEPKAE